MSIYTQIKNFKMREVSYMYWLVFSVAAGYQMRIIPRFLIYT